MHGHTCCALDAYDAHVCIHRTLAVVLCCQVALCCRLLPSLPLEVLTPFLAFSSRPGAASALCGPHTCLCVLRLPASRPRQYTRKHASKHASMRACQQARRRAGAEADRMLQRERTSNWSGTFWPCSRRPPCQTSRPRVACLRRTLSQQSLQSPCKSACRSVLFSKHQAIFQTIQACFSQSGAESGMSWLLASMARANLLQTLA